MPLWRNGLACWTSNSKVVGSSPTRGGIILIRSSRVNIVVSPLNVITPLNVIATVNVTQINAKCNANRKCNKTLTLNVINLPTVNVIQLNAKCNNRVNLLNRAKDSKPSTSDFHDNFFHFLGLFLWFVYHIFDEQENITLPRIIFSLTNNLILNMFLSIN